MMIFSATFGRLFAPGLCMRCCGSASPFSETQKSITGSWPSFRLFEASDNNSLAEVANSFKIRENFITEDEERALVQEIEPHLKRLRYEQNHWDNAIIGYREVERNIWSKDNQKVIQRVRQECFPSDARHLGMVHCLDIAEEGEIKPHIDAVRFCGSVIAGLSLLSDAVMKLALERDSSGCWVNVLLPRRSVYVMTGPARFNYSHAILGQAESVIRGQPVLRKRRISVMFRVQPELN